MRIVFTVTNELTYDQRMHRICETLAQQGHTVTLVGRQYKNSPAFHPQHFFYKRLHCFFKKGKFFYAEYNLRLFFYMIFKKLDIVCSIDLDTLLPGYLVTKWRSKKLVYDAHEYYTGVIELAGRKNVYKFWKGLEAWIVPQLKYAYTVNKSIARLYQEEYNVPFDVIRNVPLLGNSITGKGGADLPLIYAGAVNEGRGLEELLHAMVHLDKNLIICGDGDILPELKTLSQSLNIDHKVTFTGYQQPEELRKWLAEASIGLNLLRNESVSYYYSLANKFFDYMHAGLPQVTMNFPEYVLINEQRSIAITIDLDVNEIIRAVENLQQDPALYEQLRSNALAARKQYNWEEESKKLISFYEEITV